MTKVTVIYQYKIVLMQNLLDIYALCGVVQECNHNNDRGTCSLVSNYATSHHCKAQIHETTDRKLHKERKA